MYPYYFEGGSIHLGVAACENVRKLCTFMMQWCCYLSLCEYSCKCAVLDWSGWALCRSSQWEAEVSCPLFTQSHT